MSYDVPPEEYAQLHPQTGFEPGGREPKEERRRMAQADLGHFRGITLPERDRLIKREDVVTLFTVAFGYSRSYFEKLDHAQHIQHDLYRSRFAWKRHGAPPTPRVVLYYKSRIIRLIYDLKQRGSISRGQPEELPEPPPGYGYAAREILRHEGVVVPRGRDRLLTKAEVRALFAQAFAYSPRSWRNYDHYELAQKSYYRGSFAAGRGGDSGRVERYLKSRILALIKAIKGGANRREGKAQETRPAAPDPSAFPAST